MFLVVELDLNRDSPTRAGAGLGRIVRFRLPIENLGLDHIPCPVLHIRYRFVDQLLHVRIDIGAILLDDCADRTVSKAGLVIGFEIGLRKPVLRFHGA